MIEGTDNAREQQRIIEDIDSVIRNPETLALARLPGGENLIIEDIMSKPGVDQGEP